MDTAEKTMQEGYTLVQSGSHEEALEAFLRAEALYAAAGDGQRQARACTNKALVLVQLRRFADALDGFRAGFIGHAEGSLMVGVVMSAVLTMVMGAACWLVFRSGWRQKS